MKPIEQMVAELDRLIAIRRAYQSGDASSTEVCNTLRNVDLDWLRSAALRAAPEQGSPEARLRFISELAEKYCGHSMFSSEPPELAIQRALSAPEGMLGRKAIALLENYFERHPDDLPEWRKEASLLLDDVDDAALSALPPEQTIAPQPADVREQADVQAAVRLAHQIVYEEPWALDKDLNDICRALLKVCPPSPAATGQ